MKLDLTDMLYAMSFALNKAETELIGIDTEKLDLTVQSGSL